MKKFCSDYFEEKGINKKLSKLLATQFENDWNIVDASEEEKEWALRNGFRPTRILQYGLNESNVKDYLSDVDYFKMHPLNNHFAIWINDKITLKYVLPNEINVNGKRMALMPKYYLYIENDGKYTYLMDSPIDLPKDKYFLLNLVKEVGILAMKPSNGAGGKGFIKLEYIDGKLYWNANEIAEDVFQNEIKELTGYIISEYVYQHHQTRDVWPSSENTLRVVAVRNFNNPYDGGKIDIISSYIRFGSVISNGVCNMALGGLNLAFDWETGKYGDYMTRHRAFCPDGNIYFKEHPDTHVSLQGKKLPNLDLVHAAVYSICEHLSSLEFFGFDVIVCEDHVKVCEVNTLPGLDSIQILDGPIWKNPKASRFFNRKLKDKNLTRCNQ